MCRCYHLLQPTPRGGDRARQGRRRTRRCRGPATRQGARALGPPPTAAEVQRTGGGTPATAQSRRYRCRGPKQRRRRAGARAKCCGVGSSFERWPHVIRRIGARMKLLGRWAGAAAVGRRRVRTSAAIVTATAAASQLAGRCALRWVGLL